MDPEFSRRWCSVTVVLSLKRQTICDWSLTNLKKRCVDVPKSRSVQPSIIILMCFCSSIINTPTMPGKVIILYKSTWRPNRPTSPLWESEREKGEKKSISLINLARLATLARLIWINKMACSFSSACCPQFNFDLLMELTPIWLAKFVWVDWACLASWRYGDKWHRQMCLFVQTLATRTLRLYILRSHHAPMLLPMLCVCLHSLFSTRAAAAAAVRCVLIYSELREFESASNTRPSQCSSAWPRHSLC